MLARIKIKNIFSYILEGDVEYFKNLLRVREQGYIFSSKYKSGLWDGYIYFVKKNAFGQYYFPSGFIFAYPQWFKDCILIDERQQPSVNLNQDLNLNGIELRDYQKEAIKKAINYTRGIINLATNAGKTEVAIGIAKCLSNLRVLFITHRQHLLFQTKERFEQRLGEKVGYVGVGKHEITNHRIIVATIQTLYSLNYEKFLNSFDVVFWDEVHHLSSDTWYEVGKRIKAYYRFGLTATVPASITPRWWKLVALTGGIIYRVGQKVLVDRGISALPFIYMIEVDEKRDGDYQSVYKELIEESSLRNNLVKQICEKFKDLRKVLVVKTIRHGEILKQKFITDAILLTGKEDIKERLFYLEKFRKGEVKTLIVTTWFEEGTDIPEIEVFVNTAGGLSDKLLIQRMGRAVRKKEGENKVIIIDFFDKGNKYLRRHSRNRLKTYQDEEFEVKVIKSLNNIP
jgi:superfamily II DNA or RNA helicase